MVAVSPADYVPYRFLLTGRVGAASAHHVLMVASAGPPIATTIQLVGRRLLRKLVPPYRCGANTPSFIPIIPVAPCRRVRCQSADCRGQAAVSCNQCPI